jgi:hypothetical protein
MQDVMDVINTQKWQQKKKEKEERIIALSKGTDLLETGTLT